MYSSHYFIIPSIIVIVTISVLEVFECLYNFFYVCNSQSGVKFLKYMKAGWNQEDILFKVTKLVTIDLKNCFWIGL